MSIAGYEKCLKDTDDKTGALLYDHDFCAAANLTEENAGGLTPDQIEDLRTNAGAQYDRLKLEVEASPPKIQMIDGVPYT